MKRIVVDSSMLQSEALQTYLSESDTNFVVLPDYVSMEAYKVDSIDRILERMQVVCRSPRQVLILKDTTRVCGLQGGLSEVQAQMIDEQQTAGFPEYCVGLERARGGDRRYQRALLGHAEAAKEHIDSLLSAVPAIAEGRREIAATYSAEDLRIIRTNAVMTEALKTKFVKNVLALSALQFGRHPSVNETHAPDFDELLNRYLFRFSLCSHIWLLEWIAHGSAERSKATRVRNHLVDLTVAAYATYFDELMTADANLALIESTARAQLAALPLPYSDL
jgi:hypothetical protein